MPKVKTTNNCTCTRSKCGFACGYRQGKRRARDWVVAKKQAAAGRSFADGYQVGKCRGQKIAIKSKTATKKGVKLAGAAAALPIIWAQAASSSTRAKTTTKAHRQLVRKSTLYASYHQHKHHRKFHYAAVGSHILVYVMIGLAVFTTAISPARAYSDWNQSDWSGGVGTNTGNQYDSANNVVTSTAGQLTLDTATISDWCNNASCDAMWVKRKKVGINNAGTVGTNVVVKVDVAYDSDMQADFGDLRFTTTDGTELPYFVMKKTNSVSATVYVKLTTLTIGLNNFYMYYGNGAATSDSDVNILDFYDDFSGSSLDGAKWNIDQNNGLSVSGGKLTLPINSNGANSVSMTNSLDRTVDRAYEWTTEHVANGCHEIPGGWMTNEFYSFDFSPGFGAENYPCNELGIIYNRTDGFSTYNNFKVAYTQEIRFKAIVRSGTGGTDVYYSLDNGNKYNFVGNHNSGMGWVTDARFKVYQYGTTFKISSVAAYQTIADMNPDAYSTGIEQSQSGKVGTLTSAVFDAGVGAYYGNVNLNSSGSGIIGAAVRSSNDAGMSGEADLDSCTLLASGSAISASNCVSAGERYLQYRVYLSDGASSTLNLADITLEHDNDAVPPSTNASNLVMKRTISGDTITNAWTNNQSPYFSWTAATDSGSGIKGYCVYIGTDQTGDPISTKGGIYDSSPIDSGGACQYVVSSPNINLDNVSHWFDNGSTYYLNIKAIDSLNNVYAGSSAQYQFGFDNNPPGAFMQMHGPSSYVNSSIFNISWDYLQGPQDDGSGVAGIQYCIDSFANYDGECDNYNSTKWFGPAHTSGLGDVFSASSTSFTTKAEDSVRIAEGMNYLIVKLVDNAGNSYGTGSLYFNYSTSAPTTPQNLNVSPGTSTSNNFSFSWNAPATYIGQASGINYCWSVNALPAANTCTFAGAGITSLSAGAYATQPGLNTMYIVARDEAGNIDYANRASVNFTANTAAPGAPRTMSVVDASIKDTADWKLALSWAVPSLAGSGVHHYDIYRSPDNLVFNKIGSTTATSFVDASLEQIRYYYYVKACDNAYNCGAASNTDDELPTGRFTSPAKLTSGPDSSDISTRKAKISWSTERASDSKVQLGTKSGQYDPDQVANSTQVTGHTINLTNLRPGTTYFYKAQWTDRDGNTGGSGEKSFTTLPAPSCRDVAATKIGLTEATLQLTCRDTAKLKVLYGKSEQFGGVAVVNTSTTESTYSVPLTGLDDGTKYSYKLNTYDADGNEYEGAVTFSFTTPARPRISNLRFQTVDGEPTSTQKVTWTTNVPTTSDLNYGKIGTGGTDMADSKLVTEHEIIIRGLEDNSEYYLVANSRDGSGNLATSDRQIFHTALDTRPPKITKVTIEPSVKGSGADARGQLIVSWHTDEQATSQVSFDDGKSGTTSRTNEDAALVTDHVVVVSDLSPAQVYSVKAISRDKAGNSAESTTQSAIIGRASDSIFAIIFNALQQIFGLSSK